MALALFLRWLDGEGARLGDVDRSTIVRYVRALVVEPSQPLSAATVNHRLSVLRTFFAWYVTRNQQDRPHTLMNPVPGPEERVLHRAAGRDAPQRFRAELRRRAPVRVPRSLDSVDAGRLVDAAVSVRDRAILTLLWRTGARIGDWIGDHDRHGVLGLAIDDIDARRCVVRLRLKGARDEHTVPVTDDFWALWARHRAADQWPATRQWAWEGRRRGQGHALRYDAFAAMLRGVARAAGVRAHAHMFRHGLAEALTATSGLQVAQQVLGHRHLSTTAEFYARVDEAAMVAGVQRAAQLARAQPSLGSPAEWAFDYDEVTLDELARLTSATTTEL